MMLCRIGQTRFGQARYWWSGTCLSMIGTVTRCFRRSLGHVLALLRLAVPVVAGAVVHLGGSVDPDLAGSGRSVERLHPAVMAAGSRPRCPAICGAVLAGRRDSGGLGGSL